MPPFARSALECAPVNNSHAASDAEKLDAVFRFQVAHQWRYFFDGARERLRLRDLRTDVHLHADNLDVAHSGCAFINRADLIQCDAEFVLLGAGRDVLMRVRVDIRVDAQCDWRAHVLCAGDALNQIQFSFTLDVEAVEPLAPVRTRFPYRICRRPRTCIWPDRRPPRAHETTRHRTRCRNQRPPSLATSE